MDEQVEIIQLLNVHIRYREQMKSLALVVVMGDGPSSVGQNWLKYI